MSAIVRVARLLIAMTIAVGNSAVLLPIWLVRGLFLRQKGKGYPNTLQYILNGVGRQTLKWQALIGAQPGHYTRPFYTIEKWLSPSSELIFVKPVGKADFDDSMLPVKLDQKELNKDVAALWYRNKNDTSPLLKRKSPVVLYFHGGAYITLEPDDVFMGVTGARNYTHYGQIDLFSVAYRLAPGSKYPSQLYEAYSAFQYLRQQGYQHITISGDSAGANLALTLWRYLEEVKHESESVASLALFSPWLDMNGMKRPAFQASLNDCVVTPTYVGQGFKKMQTNNKPSAQDPWMSPIKWTSTLIKKLPPTFIAHGGAETLVDEGVEFIKKAQHNGVKIQHDSRPGYCHDYQNLPWYPYASAELYGKTGQFIKKHSK